MHKICPGCAQEMPASATVCSLCSETLGKVFTPPNLGTRSSAPVPQRTSPPRHTTPPAPPPYPPRRSVTEEIADNHNTLKPTPPHTPAKPPPQYTGVPIFCNQCGKQKSPGKNFCGHCGAVSSAQPLSPSDQTVLLFPPDPALHSDPTPFTLTEPGPPPFPPSQTGPVPFAPPNTNY